ncbi:glycosyltransferase family 88 protein [Candidatus Rickettsiella viridis]|uniref:glycosyltransferase family 88 protein n=1 Tax=Candidatus Rickettsiella viridis TaxID=676208 RepID=UPI000F82F8DF|nr:glycosyltransferase family 88 protein [Candidatus Rickettsiella viridis]
MTYTFNPHRHVKIWLTKDPDSFLNLENQIRLVNMRSVNQYDEIHLIYDRSLLSEKAFNDLTKFCEKHHILSHDVQQNIIPFCQSVEEKRLITIYQDEIQHLNEAGNVAVASDILRWLKPIYTLGTYSDFDTNIDTRHLPSSMEVKQNILFNMGSVVVSGHFQQQEYELLQLNNDIIAVVDPETAEPTIKQIQCSLYEACYKPQSSEDSPFSAYVAWDKEGVEKLGLVFPQSIQHQYLTVLAKIAEKRTSRELRVEIIRQTENNQIFCKEMAKMAVCDVAIGIREALVRVMEDRELPEKLIRESKKKLAMSDEDLVASSRETCQSKLLKLSVTHTTGPGGLLVILFSPIYEVSSVEFTDTIIPYGLCHYGLEKAFQSGQHLAFHSTPAAYSQLMRSEIGEKNDCSWLSRGQALVQKREARIKKAASIIQQFYRENKLKNQMVDVADNVRNGLKIS